MCEYFTAAVAYRVLEPMKMLPARNGGAHDPIVEREFRSHYCPARPGGVDAVGLVADLGKL
ncbi:hypothetical protein FQK02_02380 [Xanthomonas vasicola]|nr:hypothetical protein FQK02_02380 [Xanthomonas vasicola]